MKISRNMQSNNIELSVRVNGNNLAEFHKDGRVFIMGKVDGEYSLRIKNDNPYRVKVVPSIDGVSVLSGKPATAAPSEAGYVLGAYESTVIDGYRLDNDSCAAFRFVETAKGYATKEKGLSGTTGVIGLRVWREKEEPAPTPPPIVIEKHHHHGYGYPWWHWQAPVISNPWWEYQQVVIGYKPSDGIGGTVYGYSAGDSVGSSHLGARCSDTNTLRAASMNLCSSSAPTAATARSAATKCSAHSPSLDNSMSFSSTDVAPSSLDQPFNLGSTFGAKLQSKVKEVTFQVGALLTEISLYYATRDGLKALGIDLSRTDKVAFPQAFGAYCKPPSDWTG